HVHALADVTFQLISSISCNQSRKFRLEWWWRVRTRLFRLKSHCGCLPSPPGRESRLHFVHPFLIKRVNQQRGRLEEGGESGHDREGERNTEQRLGSLHHALYVAEAGQEKRKQQVADDDTGFDREQRGGINQPGGPAPELPLAPVGDVSIERPGERRGRTAAELGDRVERQH